MALTCPGIPESPPNPERFTSISHLDGRWAALQPRRLPGDPGIGGRLVVAVIVAEIGDITPVPPLGPAVLVGRAGAGHRESDTKGIRGRITKQGSRLLRYS
jgi:hypothetical protein